MYNTRTKIIMYKIYYAELGSHGSEPSPEVDL